MSAAQNPDAELIRLSAEHKAALDAYNAAPSYNFEEDPLWAAYTEKLNAIEASEPKTLAGLVAKARVAKLEADPYVENMATDVLDDLLRLFGGVQ